MIAKKVHKNEGFHSSYIMLLAPICVDLREEGMDQINSKLKLKQKQWLN